MREPQTPAFQHEFTAAANIFGRSQLARHIMFLDKNLTGRSEKRLPVMVVVRLSAFQAGKGEVEEETYTDNLSSGGVRVCSLRRWQPGDQVEVAPVDQGPPMQGQVVYCQKSDKARFFVGLKFHRGHACWRILQRYGSA
jgi:hypothetical protein